jgi:hypothetical protein
MDLKKIMAVSLNLPIDYEKIKKELLSTREMWKFSPPWESNIRKALSGQIFMSESLNNYHRADYQNDVTKQVVKKELPGQYIFYLRENLDNVNNIKRFDYTKTLPTDKWVWIDHFKTSLPYTIECIENLPYKHIGCIRVFITENTFFATHRDYGWGRNNLSKDYDRCFGLSIIPDTGGVPMKIQSFKNNNVYDIYGNAMLFNDSAWHGVPYVSGLRITIRIFGEINYQSFMPYMDSDTLVIE